MSSLYLTFCVVCITVLKELNAIVDEPYMVRIPCFDLRIR
jgi:alpha-1,2-glucosyltransferase